MICDGFAYDVPVYPSRYYGGVRGAVYSDIAEYQHADGDIVLNDRRKIEGERRRIVNVQLNRFAVVLVLYEQEHRREAHGFHEKLYAHRGGKELYYNARFHQQEADGYGVLA